MITNISTNDLYRDFRVRDLIPQAILNTPISYFSEHLGMTVEEDADDFDSFQGTAMVLNHIYPVAIRHYRGHPKETVTVYLASDITNVENITSIIHELVGDLKLQSAAIRWERIQDPLL